MPPEKNLELGMMCAVVPAHSHHYTVGFVLFLRRSDAAEMVNYITPALHSAYSIV